MPWTFDRSGDCGDCGDYGNIVLTGLSTNKVDCTCAKSVPKMEAKQKKKPTSYQFYLHMSTNVIKIQLIEINL